MKHRVLCFVFPVILCLTTALTIHAADTRWVTTNYWSAGGDTTTRVFNVFGDTWQIHYVNRDTGTLEIRVMVEDGSTLDKAIRTDRPLRGIHTFEGAGRYYLKASGSSGHWEISVRQRLTRLQEWDLRQENASLESDLEKVASFTGENGREDFSLKIARGRWKFSYQNGTGETSLRVIDAGTGEVVFHRVLTRPEKAESWVHRPGTFRIETEAVDGVWRVDVFAQSLGDTQNAVRVESEPDWQ